MKQKNDKIVIGIGIILLLVTSLIALSMGPFQIPFGDTIKILFGKTSDIANAEIVIMNIRLPRILFSMVAGSGLAIAGVAFQALFANPLATTDTLGISNGASFGAALGILFHASVFVTQLSAMLFGMIAVALVYLFSSSKNYGQSKIMIILSGIVISSLFFSLVSLVKYVADPNDVLPVITFWLMGSFSSITVTSCIQAIPMILIGILILYLLRYRFNLLTLQEEEAITLGINIKLLRILVIVSASLITASVVSICGVIGWVGLLIPHIARMLLGNNHVRIVPISLLFGAEFMLCIDTLARCLTNAEIPVSILTAIIGAPVFIMILRKTGGIQI